ncbi:Hypothetical predicted protein [Mytilus galloprovincialis]|uniref:Uncharacterized protein n=1 Tax=Mytilus galloprovincialis TaxID=29158 RepID=A0A8B6E630_MYTGA|nr:Hypothetical predicted protein [Mytilus galloprovincialis]
MENKSYSDDDVELRKRPINGTASDEPRVVIVEDTAKLKQSVGIISGISFIVGSVIGSLSYAEIGCVVKKSGGEYAYIDAAMGRLMAFMFAWTKIIVLTPSSVAVISLTFASYCVTFFPYCGEPQVPLKVIAALAIVTLTIINCYDTRAGASVQVFFTAAKLIALAIIIVGGLVRLGQGKHIDVFAHFKS